MIAAGPHLAYFFDIDGTLIDLAEAPDGVRVDRRLRRLLVAVHAATGGALALISGRSLADIDRLFPDVPMPAAGQHGVERRDAGGLTSRHAFPEQRLNAVRPVLLDAVHRTPGLLIEDKHFSVAVHYRRAPEAGEFVRELCAAMARRLGPRFTVQEGKYVIELKPGGKDKGVAILEFMREQPFHGRPAVFIGDDATDEYGFRVVNRLDGHSIKVGPGPTVARDRLAGVPAVRQWIEQGFGAGVAE